jgi:hypothetical protein
LPPRSEAEHGNDGEREAEVPAECAHGVADVGHEFLEGQDPACPPHFLLHLFHAAECDAGVPGGRGAAGRCPRLGLAIEVEPELLIELALGAIAEKQRLEALDQVGSGHARAGVGRTWRMSFTAPDARCQSEVSAASCLAPSRVRM